MCKLVYPTNSNTTQLPQCVSTTYRLDTQVRIAPDNLPYRQHIVPQEDN